MLKNLKMALKMALGFGSLVILLIVVGGLAAVNLLNIRTDAIRLRDEYVAEVAIANELERNSLQTMYAMRGYSLTFEDSYFSDARENLSEVRHNLDQAEALAAQYSGLQALAASVEQAQAAADAYTSLADETSLLIDEIHDARTVNDEAAGNVVPRQEKLPELTQTCRYWFP